MHLAKVTKVLAFARYAVLNVVLLWGERNVYIYIYCSTEKGAENQKQRTMAENKQEHKPLSPAGILTPANIWVLSSAGRRVLPFSPGSNNSAGAAGAYWFQLRLAVMETWHAGGHANVCCICWESVHTPCLWTEVSHSVLWNWQEERQKWNATDPFHQCEEELEVLLCSSGCHGINFFSLKVTLIRNCGQRLSFGQSL